MSTLGLDHLCCLSVSGDQYRLPAMAEEALQEARAKGLTMEKVVCVNCSRRRDYQVWGATIPCSVCAIATMVGFHHSVHRRIETHY